METRSERKCLSKGVIGLGTFQSGIVRTVDIVSCQQKEKNNFVVIFF